MAEKESSLRKTNSLTFTHHWTIDNFASLYDENCQWKWDVESEEFSVPGNEDLKFSLGIWPKEGGKYGQEHLNVGLYAYQVPEMWEGKVTVKEVRSIQDDEGKKFFTKAYPDKEVYKNKWINADEFVYVPRLLHSSTGYLRKGTLTVLTRVTLLSQENPFNCPSSFNPHTFSSTTTIPSSVTRLSHRFIISHFKWLTEESTRGMPYRVESQYFAPQREDIGKMKLRFYPKGIKGNDEEKVDIVIRNDNPSSLLVHWEYSLVDSKGDRCHQYEYTHQIPSLTSRVWSLTRRTLLSLLSSLPKDELIIDCNVTVLVPEKGVNTLTPSCTFIDLALFNYHYVHFTWTIEDYLKQVSTRECTVSPLFSPPTDSRLAAFLRVYPKKDKEKVQIELNFAANCQIDECKVEWRFSVVNAKGEEWNSWVWNRVLEKGKGTGPQNLISHETLDNNQSLLPDDKLTIKSQLWIHEPRKELSLELANPSTSSHVADLSSGITNISIVNSNVNVNNAILSAQSSFTSKNINQRSIDRSEE